MTKNEDLKAFDAWADDYLKREYPFYTTGAIADVCRALKSQLYAAWKAGAETRPTVTPADGDSERALKWFKDLIKGRVYTEPEIAKEIIDIIITALKTRTPPVPVDTIAVPKEVLRGALKEMKEYEVVAHAKTITDEDKNYWEGRRIGFVISQRIIEEQLASLDAVLSGGKS